MKSIMEDIHDFPIGVARIARDGSVLHCNDLFIKLFLPGQITDNVYRLIPEWKHEAFHDWLEGIVANRTHLAFKLACPTELNSSRTLLISASCDRENNTCLLVVNEYITPIHIDNPSNQQYINFFDELMDFEGFIVFRYNFMESKFDYCSPSINRFLLLSGKSITKLSGDELIELVHPDDREQLKTIIRQQIGGESLKSSLKIEFRLNAIPNSFTWLQSNLHFVRDMQGSTVSCVGITLDITRQKQTEQALVASRNQLEKRVMNRTLELIKTNERLLGEITDRIHAEIEVKESEERFRSIFEQGYDGIVLLDARGYVIAWNRAMTAMTGMNEDIVVGHPFWEIQQELSGNHRHHQRLNLWRNRIERYRENGTADFINMVEEDILTLPDRKQRIIERIVFPIKTSTELRLGIFMRDITTTRQSLEALRESEEKFRILSEESPNLIFIFSKHKIEYVNAVWKKMTGYSRDELRSSDFALTKAIIPKDRLKVLRIIARLEYPGVIPAQEITLEKISGERLALLVNCRKIYFNGKPAVLAIASDVTDIRRMQRQIADAKRFEEIERLSAGVAHEVRNPLNAIVAISEMLKTDFGHLPVMAEYLEHIGMQVQRLARLMGDLLEFSKITNIADLEEISLLTLCYASIKMWQQAEKYPGYEVEIDHSSCEADPFVRADISRMQQVLINLLDNAAQHSRDEKIIVMKVSIGEDQCIIIEIIDRGHGINPKDITRVFDPFFTRRSKGSGLGLSIVRSIIEKMDGTIRLLNNDPPPGCRAVILLPQVKRNVQ